MRTLTEFKEFCISEIAPVVRILEEERQGIEKQLLFSTVLLIILTILFVLFAIYNHLLLITATIYFLILASWLWHYKKTSLTAGYKDTFKRNVISKIIEFVDADLKYEPQKRIDESKFIQSGLSSIAHNKYGGDDYVSGRIGQIQVEFSELYSMYNDSVLFKGLFFIGQFNKNFAGWTIVLPDRAEKTIGFSGRILQPSQKSGGKLVKLDDPEFEKEFAVYSTDEIEARYILTNSLMSRIVNFKEKANRKISLSFFGGQVYIAIQYYEHLFEPKLFSTLLDFQPLQKYFEDLELAIGIVDDLNLNTRIWTKQ